MKTDDDYFYERLEKINNFLVPFGFEEKELRPGIFTHKMFDGGIFDMTSTDPDTFCIMDTIFKNVQEYGKKQKQEELIGVLGL
jgi:hypothetical protein